MTPAETLLARLDKVRTRPAGKFLAQYEACCPAHADKSPSLGIAVADDGRLVINCLAGCQPDDVMTAIGLELKDLFPPQDNYKPFWRDKSTKRSSDMSLDEWVVFTGEQNIKNGKRLSDADKARLLQAKIRLKKRDAA